LQCQALSGSSGRREALACEDLLGGQKSIEAVRLPGPALAALWAFDLEHFDLLGLQVLA
jgi:hypothetical protein